MDRRNALGLLLGAIAAGCGGGKDTGIVGRGTYFSYVSDPGDSAGGGEARMITPDNSKWVVNLDESRNTLRIGIFSRDEAPIALCHFHSAQRDNGLHSGFYSPVEGATGVVETESAEMGVSFNWVFFPVSGNFTIHNLAVDTNNQVTNLFISFEQHSDKSSNPAAMLRGEISYQASTPTTGA